MVQTGLRARPWQEGRRIRNTCSHCREQGVVMNCMFRDEATGPSCDADTGDGASDPPRTWLKQDAELRAAS